MTVIAAFNAYALNLPRGTRFSLAQAVQGVQALLGHSVNAATVEQYCWDFSGKKYSFGNWSAATQITRSAQHGYFIK